MRSFVESVFKRLGIELISSQRWRLFQRRYAELEVEAKKVATAQRHSDQIEAASRAAAARTAELEAMLAAAHADLARSDTSGRLASADSEIAQLKKRILDLEAYLKRARERGSRYYL